MKLKDFKDKPEQYNKLVESLRQKGIASNDYSDVNDLIAEVNSYKTANAIKAMADGANKLRSRR